MKELKSNLRKYIQDFVDLKRASGYPYDTSERILHAFDDMITEQFPKLTTITAESIEAWINLYPNEHPNTLARRIPPVRQLGVYLNGLGIPSYVVPGHIPNRQIKYEAHIYTKDELKSFFRAIDGVQFNPMAPTRSFVIPVIFRFYYCCGMRSSEARLLRCEDVNLTTGKIVIRESKGWRARVLYMSDDLLGICKEYNEIVEEFCPNRVPFFPNKDGNFYNESTIDVWFHKFWDPCHPKNEQINNSPRVHDFRHTYATNRLNKWVEEGEDIQVLYPSFSEYLGHSNFADTDYYLKLTTSFYQEMNKRMKETNDLILPEVSNEEE